MNALTPLEQRRMLEARVTFLERVLRRHGLLASEAPSKLEPGWVEAFMGDSSASDGRAIVRRAVRDAAKFHGFDPEAILGQGRIREISHARQDAMLWAHRDGASFSQIARAMRRDHTTIIHGVRAAKKRRGEA